MRYALLEGEAVIGWLDTDVVDYPSLPPDEHLVAVSDEQWEQRMASAWAVRNGAFVAAEHPATPLEPPSPHALFRNRLAAGVHIRCADHPALDGVYAIDAAAQGALALLASVVARTGEFPGGKPYPWFDIEGQLHWFPDPARFERFADAVCLLIAELADGSPTAKYLAI